MDSKVYLTCNTCKNVNQYNLSRELKGKRIKLSCKAKGCDNKIIHTVNNDESHFNKTHTIVSDNTFDRVVSHVTLVIHHKTLQNPINHVLSEGKFSLGRLSGIQIKSPDQALSIEDPYMSRKHVMMNVSKNDKGSIVTVLKDLESTNGVIINNSLKLAPDEIVYLQNEDSIQLGETTLIYKEH